ncbi:hypothetical protein ASG41_07625 [Modestobacter sp. Leaf380]|nr:hypothetical protein ASG41_07625 [Modestobacter sp. Leaf380]
MSAVPGAHRPAARLAVTLAVLLLGGIVTAGPAAAIEDPTRPSGRVVYGPNCTDGFVRIAVTNGSEPLTLTMGYDGVAAGPATELAAGAQATLQGREVDWGTTVVVDVAVEGADGPEDPLTFRDYTRPTEADCAAVAPPTGTEPTTSAPTTTPVPTTTVPTTTPAPAPTPTTPRPTRPTPSPTASPTTTAPTTTAPTTTPTTTPPATTAPPATPSGPTAAPTPSGPLGGTVSSGQVSPGSVVTVRGTGFTPGEEVTVSLGGVAAPLATVTADELGRVEAVVQIPQDVVLGSATVQLLGRASAASTAVDLEIAAVQTRDDGRGAPWPLMAAGLALLLLAVALAAAAARRPRRDDWASPGTPG